MSNAVQTQVKASPAIKPVSLPAQSGLLQRKCACGGTPGVDGECEECRSKRLSMQRQATTPSAPATSPTVPPIVHDVLGSTGHALDASTRAFMEPRFGHDFSNVRVHIDARAAESARAVNALAYTVGRDVVFGAGQYTPQTSEGKRLLAHELTHVVQQRNIIPDIQRLAIDTSSTNSFENEATAVGNTITSAQPRPISLEQQTTLHTLQRAPLSKPDKSPYMVEEAAGGCGICMDARTAGRYAHRLIQEAFEIRYPTVLSEMGERKYGRTDLVAPRRRRRGFRGGLDVGEIKPARAEQYTIGSEQLGRYITALEKRYPKSVIRRLQFPLGPEVGPFPNPEVPGCLQNLYVNDPIEGVYGYFCYPPRSLFRDIPSCNCGKEKKQESTSESASTEQSFILYTPKATSSSVETAPESTIPIETPSTPVEPAIPAGDPIIPGGDPIVPPEPMFPGGVMEPEIPLPL